MKLKIWIGPLIAVIILISLRQMVYYKMENEQQRSVIPAVIEKKPEINPPMAGTRLHWDILPL
ncbi:MAG TPA: hypothetical protein VF008_22525 [Niastella sp.]